jgi:uncharacterized protein DUF3808
MSNERLKRNCIKSERGTTQLPDRLGNKLRNRTLVGISAFLLAALVQGRALAVSQSQDSDPLAQALDHFYSLEYDAAEQQLNARVKEDPDDLRALSYLARVWLEREMFRRQMLEAQAYRNDGEAFRSDKSAVDPKVRQKIFELESELESRAQAKLKLDPHNKEALYWLGTSYVIRAVYHLTLEKSTMPALSDAKEAQKCNLRVLEIDPNYADAYLVVGTYDYIVGSLPWYTKAVAALIGYSGNRQRGLDELKRAANDGHWARTDAQTFLSILYFREQNHSESIRIMRNLEQQYPRNSLLPQEIARAYKAQNDWQAAATEYDSLLQKYEAHAPGFEDLPLARVYFQAGETYSRLGDSDEALRRYKKAANSPGKSIYVFRAELAAAAIELKQKRNEDARSRYKRVAEAVPETAEGRAANQALKNFNMAGDSKSTH